MRRILAVIALMAIAFSGLAAAAPATAQTPSSEARAHGDALLGYQHDLVSVLALRADAQHLMGAALLARPLSDPGKGLSYHDLIQRAVKSADAGPATQWAALADCDNEAGNCPNAAALKALETDDADNAAVWMLVVGQRARDDDGKGMRQALHQAAGAKRYDGYAGRSLQALAQAVMALPMPADVPARGTSVNGTWAMLVLGVGQAQPMPGFALVAQMCESNKERPEVASDCLKLGKLLEWGSHPLARSLGLHLLGTLSRDDATRSDAARQRRDLVWQVQQFSKLSARAIRDDNVARKLLALAQHGGTQMSLMLAALHAFDIPVDAPAGWHEPGHDDTPAATHS